MDIPIVLNRLHPGLYWGSHAGSHSTYAKLKTKWPPSNPPLPTKAVMTTEWNKYLNEQPPTKTEAEFKTEITTYIITAAHSKKMIAALAIEQLKKKPSFFADHGIPITGKL